MISSDHVHWTHYADACLPNGARLVMIVADASQPESPSASSLPYTVGPMPISPILSLDSCVFLHWTCSSPERHTCTLCFELPAPDYSESCVSIDTTGFPPAKLPTSGTTIAPNNRLPRHSQLNRDNGSSPGLNVEFIVDHLWDHSH